MSLVKFTYSKGWTGRFPFSVSGVLGDQTQSQQSFDSRLLCCILYTHFTHIYLSKNTRPINPFNLPLLTCHLPWFQISNPGQSHTVNCRLYSRPLPVVGPSTCKPKNASDYEPLGYSDWFVDTYQVDSCCLLDEKAGWRQQKRCGGGQEIIGLGGLGSSIVRSKLAFFGAGTSFICAGTQSMCQINGRHRAEPFKPVKPPKMARVVILRRVNTLDKANVHWGSVEVYWKRKFFSSGCLPSIKNAVA